MTAPTLPRTASLQQLDAQHRAAQATNSQQVAQLVLAYFLLRVDPQNLVGTSGAWLDFSIAQILRGYERSYMLASAYSQAIRNIQIPGATPIEIPRPPDPPIEKLRRSLVYTGPGTVAVELKKLPEIVPEPTTVSPEVTERVERARVTREEQVIQVMQKAASAAAATTYKNVGNGGRDTVDELVTSKTALGYSRICKDNPCSFCLMLASRGPVYAEDSFEESNARFTGPGDHKVHDTCGCMLRPEWSRDPDNWTDQARTADELWGRMLEENPGIGGKDARNAYARMAREAGIADLTRW